MSLRRIIERSHSPNRPCLTVILMCFLLYQGCLPKKNIRATYPLQSHLNKTIELEETIEPEETLEQNHFLVAKDVDVIGQLAVVKLEKVDSLPDIARHFGLGINTLSAANPGIDVWVPNVGEQILLPLSFILPDTRRDGIVINLAAMRLYRFFQDEGQLAVSTYPVGIGTAERPTPMGKMYITRKKVRPTWYVPASIAEDYRKKGAPLPAKVPPGPLNPLGEYALYLSKSGYLVHGTNKPASVGLRATSGCIRLYPENIKKLFENTQVKASVIIVNQPYLVGQRDGIVYIEAHTPFEKSDPAELDRAYAKLSEIGEQSGRTIDWKRVEKVVAESAGFPVPIFDTRTKGEVKAIKTVKVKHPERLFGKPKVPELKTDAWYVLAANLPEKEDALRLSAIINHQGPPIPARVLSKDDRHRVLAGPFDSMDTAKEAAKALKIDLGMDGILVEP